MVANLLLPAPMVANLLLPVQMVANPFTSGFSVANLLLPVPVVANCKHFASGSDGCKPFAFVDFFLLMERNAFLLSFLYPK
jgi:hypothetical protein